MHPEIGKRRHSIQTNKTLLPHPEDPCTDEGRAVLAVFPAPWKLFALSPLYILVWSLESSYFSDYPVCALDMPRLDFQSPWPPPQQIYHANCIDLCANSAISFKHLFGHHSPRIYYFCTTS